MSISIAICELDAAGASCRELKKNVLKVLLDDIKGFEDAAEYEETADLGAAKGLFQDWGAFMKRNGLSKDIGYVCLDQVSDADDLEALRTISKRTATGWVSVPDLGDRAGPALSRSKAGDRITGWDMISFDEMNAICASCPLSWDKGRGCIGAFGPENSALPEIAGRRGCAVVASVPEGAANKRVYTPEDGMSLIKEVADLESALPEEGKVYVRRYAGCLERLKAVAEISVREGCGFYFF